MGVNDHNCAADSMIGRAGIVGWLGSGGRGLWGSVGVVCGRIVGVAAGENEGRVGFEGEMLARQRPWRGQQPGNSMGLGKPVGVRCRLNGISEGSLVEVATWDAQ